MGGASRGFLEAQTIETRRSLACISLIIAILLLFVVIFFYRKCDRIFQETDLMNESNLYLKGDVNSNT